RAVGQANKANQIPIIIPCHRVIGKSGDLVGYAGNRTSFKEKLLEAEGFLQK
ncbi:MAG: MGMT family protein, partial [Bacillota bacterium]|nr:MGMT family protein [Bacillota bacterium]